MFVDISDHLANFLILGPKQTRKDRKNVRIFSDANKSKFKENLSNIDWTNELKCKTVDEAMSFFYHSITKAYNKSFPIVKLSRKRAKDKPWITSGLKSSIKKKHILYRRFLLDKSDKSHMEYKTYNNKLRTIIREAEISYYKKRFNEKENGIKQMWKTLSPILNMKKNKPNQKSINKLIIDGKAVYNDKQIANALNEYFSSVGNTLSKQISNKNRSYKDYLKNPLPRSIYLTPTDEKEICTEIDKLKPKKSTLDIFNINMLKYVKDEMIPGLVIIFNKSISEGIFPELLKTAKVIPIYKKDDTNFAKNYRPISLLSVFDKIIEKLVYKRVQSFLNKHNVLYKYQYGFRTNFSTTHALLDVLNYIYTALDEGKYVFGIYIDLKKAFDTVNHNILLTKLEYYGIRGLALKWFTSYLNNRSQFVSTNGVTSNIKRLGNYGVPQGSVLGPCCFYCS